MHFRPLNQREQDMIRSLIVKKKLSRLIVSPFEPELLVSYESLQGGFCVCLILSGGHIFRGASRKSLKDKHNQVRAEMVAFRRALLYSHPVESPLVRYTHCGAKEKDGRLCQCQNDK